MSGALPTLKKIPVTLEPVMLFGRRNPPAAEYAPLKPRRLPL
jgi:hypothetical protein